MYLDDLTKERYAVEVDESVWQFMKKHLGYNDEEMKKFRENPRNVDVLAKAPELMNKTIVAEVVESKNCNSQHKVGDKLIFDGAGNLLTKKNPKRICIYALAPLAQAIFAINELVYAGVDPNEIRFKRAGCFDVGVDCGGWGHIVMEIRVEERQK
jgi:uncharacterized repeat protein (TIGR04076 family)